MANKWNGTTIPLGWKGPDRRFAETVKENVDVLTGQRGDPLDRAITARDLLESGIASLPSGSTVFGGSSRELLPTVTFANLDTPPAPVIIFAEGAFQNILLKYSVQKYYGHSGVEVHRHTSDDIANATLIGRTGGYTAFYSDAVGGGQTYYYWVRAVNDNGVTGPFNSSQGTLGQTAPDIGFLLEVLTEQITSSQLATALSTPIATIPTLTGVVDSVREFTGYTVDYEGSNILSRLGVTEGIASAGATSIGTINTTLTSVNTTIGNLQESVADLTSGVSSVYVQDEEPTGTIATYSRWYDSDDNMAPYFYDGTDWISIADPRIVSNQSSIESLNTEIFNLDGTVKLATSTALGVLDSTVIALDGTVVSLGLAVTSLNGEVFDQDGTGKLATGASVTTLTNSVTAIYDGVNPSVIKSVQTDVTELEGEVFKADGTARLATGEAVTTLTNSVTAIYDGVNPSVIKSVQADVTALEGEVFNADGTAKLATGTALSALTNTVTAIYDGEEPSVIKSVQADVTALEGEVFNADGTAKLATGTALSALTNAVTAIYDGEEPSLVSSVQQDVSALSAEVFNADGTVKLATGSALNSLRSDLEVVYNGDNPSIITTAQSDIASLEGAVFDESGVKLATNTALAGLTQSVEAIYDGVNPSLVKTAQSDITALNSAVFDAAGVKLATVDALSELTQDVEVIYDGVNPSLIKTEQARIDVLRADVFNEDGTSRLVTGAAFSGLTNNVLAIYDPSGEPSLLKTVQGSITALNGAMFDDTGTVKVAEAVAVSQLQTEVWGDGVTPTGATSSRIDTLGASLNHPTSGLSATANAVSLITTEVWGDGVTPSAGTSKVDTITSAIFAEDGTLKLADAEAFSILNTEVFGSGGASTSRIDGLFAEVFSADGTSRLGTAAALDTLSAQINDEGGLASKVTSLGAEMFSTTGALKLATASDLNSVRTEVFPNGTANASRLSQLSSAVWSGGNPASGVLLASADFVSNINTAVFGSETGQQASANKIDTLQVVVTGADGVSGLKGSIQTTQDIVSGANGLTSQYTVKIDSGTGAVSGFGLSSTPNGSGNTTSAFIVEADRFAIINPNASPISNSNSPPSSLVPFQYTAYQAPSAANGFNAIPAGVYIDAAFIKNASITTAQIAKATVDFLNVTGTLSANKIEGGSIDTSLLNIDGVSLTSENGALRVRNINASLINAGTLNCDLIDVEELRVNKITGPITTMIPFKMAAPLLITIPAYGTQLLWAGVIPANNSDVQKKPYLSATGWGVFENNDVYRIELWMRANEAQAVNQSLGTVVSTQVITGAGIGYTYSYNQFKVAGDKTALAGFGKNLLRNNTTLKGVVSSSTYDPGTGQTNIVYTPSNTSSLIATGELMYVEAQSVGFVRVNDSFFRAPFDYHPHQFTITGGLDYPTDASVDVEIRMALYSSNMYFIPSNQTAKTWALDRIYDLEGVLMSIK